jgi:hypothetical protein
MINFIKRYWDLLGGAITGIGLAVLADFKLESVQLCYSVIILMLVSIGAFRVIRQETEKQRNKRDHTMIDSMVDAQKSIKAVGLAIEPLREGKETGKLILMIIGGLKKMKEKLKVFFSKYKGYLLTIALAILTIIEGCGGYINSLFGGVLAINGVEVLPMVTLVCTAIVGVISNGYTPEQREKIKALFTNSSTNELVKAEIKKNIKEKTAQYHQFNKVLATQETEKAALETELASLKNTLQAKREMFAMTPQLATEADVQLASNDCTNCEAKILNKNEEIAKTKEMIENLHTMLEALKSQL